MHPPAGRLILVTGIGRPGQVGEAVARAFSRRGDRVLAVDRPGRLGGPPAGGAAAADDLLPRYEADLSDPEQVAPLARRIADEHGPRLDAVVHLAGGWIPGADVADASRAYWEQSIARNLLTAAFVAQAFLPLVRAARGAFVFFASEAALPGARVRGMSAYAAAKQGVVALTRALAQEERSHGVRANALAPAAIRTATNERSMGSDAPYVEREQVAQAVLWLCSPAASAVTGEVLRLSAGAGEPVPAGTG